MFSINILQSLKAQGVGYTVDSWLHNKATLTYLAVYTPAHPPFHPTISQFALHATPSKIVCSILTLKILPTENSFFFAVVGFFFFFTVTVCIFSKVFEWTFHDLFSNIKKKANWLTHTKCMWKKEARECETNIIYKGGLIQKCTCIMYCIYFICKNCLNNKPWQNQQFITKYYTKYNRVHYWLGHFDLYFLLERLGYVFAFRSISQVLDIE